MNSNLLNNLNSPECIKASDIANWLLACGISSITTDGLSAMLGIPVNQVPQRMASLKRRGRIVTPAEGLWIPVPPEYSTWGAPPAIEIIDSIMRHMNTEYYVGWLSAADLHGAAHHAPQVFQVATSRAIRAREVGRSRFKFYQRAHIGHVTLMKVETRSGMASVASRETTLMDVANDIAIVGGIDNTANIIIELCDTTEPDIEALVALSEYYPVAAARRLGYLMETFTEVSGLEKLFGAIAKRRAALSLLDPQAGHRGLINMVWKIRINREVSPDV